MVDILWSENFDGPVGTNVEELGFTPQFNAGQGTIGSDQRLQIIPKRNNLFSQTEAISTVSTSWKSFSYPGTGGVAGASGAKSTVVMPDGSTNGYVYNFATGDGAASYAWSGIYQTASLTRGTYTLSVWACTPAGSGSTTIQPYIFDSGANITYRSDPITITETPTRISATIVVTGTGASGSATTYGFGRRTLETVQKSAILWGAQIETGSRLNAYASIPSTTVDVKQIWTRDIGRSNYSIECDISADTFSRMFLFCLRYVSKTSFLAVRLNGTSIGVSDQDTANNTYIPYGRTLPFRLRMEVTDNIYRLFVGDYGVENPLTQIGEVNGYTLPAYAQNNSSIVGFGYFTLSSQTTVYYGGDNYLARSAGQYITPTESISSTSSDSPMLLPASDSHNIPDWVESFGVNAGELTNIGFEKHINAGLLTSTNSRMNQQTQYTNHVYESNDPMDDSWILMNDATKTGYSSLVSFPYKQQGVKFNFGSNPDGQVRVNTNERSGYVSSSNNYKVFSVWLATESGETTVRLGTADHTNTLSGYQNVTVTTTPQRFYATISSPATRTSTSGSASTINIRGIIANNAAGTSQPVVAWGAQIETGQTPTVLYANGTKRIPSLVYTKPVSSPRQYVEFDLYSNSSSYLLSNYLYAVLRVVDSDRFVGIYYSGGNLYTYVPGVADRVICAFTPVSGKLRLRFEIFNNRLQVFWGVTGQRDIHDIIGEITFPEDLYDGFLTATKTGMGLKTTGRSSTNDFSTPEQYPVSRNYESGANIGPDRHWMTPTESRSGTTSDVILPLDLIWVESFDEPEGTALFDLGFTFETTEFNGNPRTAVVGTSNRLSYLSSSLSAAIWVKDTLTHNHFIEVEIYAYPTVTLQAPIIMRAASPEHWIGVWFEGTDMVFGYRYASSVHEYFRVVKTNWTLPFKVRMEARGHYAYLFRKASINTSTWSTLGNANGYFIDENSTPLIVDSIRTGVGRVNSTAAFNIADNIRAGIAMIPGATIGETTRVFYSTTRADVIDLNGPVIVEGIRSESITKAVGAFGKDSVVFEQFVNPLLARSETIGDISRVTADPLSYTRSDIAVTTVDIVLVNKARSSTIGDAWHQPSECTPLDTRSETTSETTSGKIHTFIYEQGDYNQPPGMDHPRRILRSESLTKSGRGPVNGWAIIDPPSDGGYNRSNTTSDRGSTIPERFIYGIKAESITIGDATLATVNFFMDPIKGVSETRADGPDTGTKDPYRPWLFT